MKTPTQTLMTNQKQTEQLSATDLESEKQELCEPSHSELPIKLTLLQEYFDEFVKVKNFKPHSRRAYETDLRYFFQFYAAEKTDFYELKRESVLNWLKQFSPRAANRRGVNIRQFLLWLEETQKLKINPEFHLPWKFTDPTPVQPNSPGELTDEDIETLLNSKDLSLTKRTILNLLIATGASLEELADLKWNNIALDKLSFVTIGEYGKERVVSLKSNVAKLLKSLRGRSFQEEDHKNNFVFTHERSQEAIDASYMAIIIRRSTNKVLGQEVSSSQLQEYAKRQIVDSNNIEVALEMLGRKKATSLVKALDQNIDLEKLRRIHSQVFA